MAVINGMQAGSFGADFVDGRNYPVHRLRSIIGTLLCAGVVPQTYQSNQVVALSEGRIKILPGSAIFEDGGMITVDAEGHIMQAGEGIRYVYFKNGLLQGDACPVISETAPAGDCIPLARIENGVVIDQRSYTKMRLEG